MLSFFKLITSAASLFVSSNNQTIIGISERSARAVAPAPPESLSPPESAVTATATAGPSLRPITTKIIGFTSFGFLPIALRWYDLLTSLGYDNHFIVATDESSRVYLESMPAVRHETEIRPGAVKTLFASRIKYIKKQLKLGYHILLTDVDNIFRRYVPTSVFEGEPYDVIHAYENKFPEDVYETQKFVVCGGMTFFRADPNGTKAYEYLNRTSTKCYRLCDDQRELNKILASQLDVAWDNATTVNGTSTADDVSNTQRLDPRFRDDASDKNFRGLGAPISSLTKSGVSRATGLRIKIWDRNFAYRGPIDPDPCPPDNWVSMPVIWVRSRKEGPLYKLRQFDLWEAHCEKEVTLAKKVKS